LDVGQAAVRVDPDGVHSGEVDDEAVVAEALAGDAVAAAAYGDG